MIKYFSAKEHEVKLHPATCLWSCSQRLWGVLETCICPAQMAVPHSALSRDSKFHSAATSFSTVWPDRRGLLKIRDVLLGTQHVFGGWHTCHIRVSRGIGGGQYLASCYPATLARDTATSSQTVSWKQKEPYFSPAGIVLSKMSY